MNFSIEIAALAMGFFGGPHCIAMCGAPCAGIAHAGAPHSTRALLLFHIGRIFGYSILGALVAASFAGLGTLSVKTAALRPVWTMFHVFVIVVGVYLMISGRQPLWLDLMGRKIWNKLRGVTSSFGIAAPLGLGAIWAFLPCALLYTALMQVSLSGSAARGALGMLLFATGSAVSLLLAPWFLLTFGKKVRGEWGVRITGLLLVIASGWGLYMALMHEKAPWCVAP